MNPKIHPANFLQRLNNTNTENHEAKKIELQKTSPTPAPSNSSPQGTAVPADQPKTIRGTI